MLLTKQLCICAQMHSCLVEFVIVFHKTQEMRHFKLYLNSDFLVSGDRKLSYFHQYNKIVLSTMIFFLDLKNKGTVPWEVPLNLYTPGATKRWNFSNWNLVSDLFVSKDSHPQKICVFFFSFLGVESWVKVESMCDPNQIVVMTDITVMTVMTDGLSWAL